MLQKTLAHIIMRMMTNHHDPNCIIRQRLDNSLQGELRAVAVTVVAAAPAAVAAHRAQLLQERAL